MANKHEVNIATIGYAVRGDTWKHLPFDPDAATRPSHKIQEEDIPHILEYFIAGINQKEIAKKYGVHHNTIGSIIKGNSWKNIDRQKITDTKAIGTRNGNAKLTEPQVKQIKELHQSGMTSTDISKKFSVSVNTISMIILGKRWKHIK